MGYDAYDDEDMNNENTQGYGLQSVDAVGMYTDAETGDSRGNAGVAFADDAYWDENGLLSPYNANGASYSGNPKPYVYDNNSNIYQYISGNGGYVDKLKEMGAPSTISGRLISYEEAVNAQSIQDNGTSIILDNHQTYCTGSAAHDHIWFVYLSTDLVSSFSYNYVAYYFKYGVRPVIEIPTSELN